MLNPIDFAYEHFGRAVAPGDKKRWGGAACLTVKKMEAAIAAGQNLASKEIVASCRRPVGGSHVFIAESGSRVFGMAYPEAGIYPSTESFSDFRLGLLFRPPQEPWMSLSFSTAGVNFEALVLNVSPNEAVLMEKSGNACRRAKPVILKEAAMKVGDFAMAKFTKAHAIYVKMINKTASNRDLADYAEITKKVADPAAFKSAMMALIENEIEPYSLVKFMEWSKNERV